MSWPMVLRIAVMMGIFALAFSHPVERAHPPASIVVAARPAPCVRQGYTFDASTASYSGCFDRSDRTWTRVKAF